MWSLVGNRLVPGGMVGSNIPITNCRFSPFWLGVPYGVMHGPTTAWFGIAIIRQWCHVAVKDEQAPNSDALAAKLSLHLKLALASICTRSTLTCIQTILMITCRVTVLTLSS